MGGFFFGESLAVSPFYQSLCHDEKSDGMAEAASSGWCIWQKK
jgi:hypothetical protein